jgi:hypothetical protein
MNVTQKLDVLAFEHSFELPGHGLRAWMVRRNAVSDQAVWNGQSFNQRDLGVLPFTSKRLSDVAARWARADDRDGGCT